MTMRALVFLAVLGAVAALVVSGGSRADSVRLRYLPGANVLRTEARYGSVRRVDARSLGRPVGIAGSRRWLERARPLGAGAPAWARRMYLRSLLVLRALTDRRTGAVVAGPREGWEYVWPRDASAAALALAAAGYRAEARRVVRFLLGLDAGAAARFHPDGSPVDGRGPQGDEEGWIAAAARAVGVRDKNRRLPWRGLGDYQEGGSGDYLGNAIASAGVREIRRDFETDGMLVREARNPGSGLDSAAAWAVRPFALRALNPAARRTLLRLAANSGRFGIVPSEGWEGGADPWTAPTAWTAWGLAALAAIDARRFRGTALRERRAALRLMAELRRAATPSGLLPERVDSRTGIPTSTTPLAWSHAFAILTLRELWP
jgi:glucoamylase